MSDRNDNASRKTSALDALVAEAKQDLTPRVTDEAWTALEDRIVARMAEEPSPVVDASSRFTRRRGNVIRIGAFVLAAAAAIGFLVRRDPGGSVLQGPSTAPAELSELTGGSLRSTEGPGEVRIGGRPAPMGHLLRAGEVVEAQGGARAILERPRKVTWLIERNAPLPGGAAADASTARARVKSAGEALILDLQDGVIEAQVTPVPSGEAFAVDIAAGSSLVRVAVHGTHLRVARTGSRVVIDLTEGVVSIGFPPRTGSTYGTLVTAPSHVEFDATNLDATLRIDHAAAAVRAPVSLVAHDPPTGPVGAIFPIAPPGAGAAGEPPVPGQLSPTLGAPPPVAPATVPRPSSVPRVQPVTKVDAKPSLPAREAIAAAVRDCAAARSRPENVRVTVTSSLKLKIAAGGDVETAQFDPPLLPEIQTCAAAAIYKAKLEDSAGGAVSIPINFSY